MLIFGFIVGLEIKFRQAELEHGMILSGRNDAPARGHGYLGTAAPPRHQASVRSLFSRQEHTGPGGTQRSAVSGRFPLGCVSTEAMRLADLGKASPGGGGLSFSHIPCDSVISGVRLGPNICGFHGSATSGRC